jgi:hypothetical protein
MNILRMGNQKLYRIETSILDEEKFLQRHQSALITLTSFNRAGDLKPGDKNQLRRMKIRILVAASGIMLSRTILFQEKQLREAGSTYAPYGKKVSFLAHELRKRYKLSRFCAWSAAEDEFYERSLELGDAYIDFIRSRS